VAQNPASSSAPDAEQDAERSAAASRGLQNKLHPNKSKPVKKGI
jgi:hypothetical protein